MNWTSTRKMIDDYIRDGVKADSPSAQIIKEPELIDDGSCKYCGSYSTLDSRGNCACCGAPKKHESNKPEVYNYSFAPTGKLSKEKATEIWNALSNPSVFYRTSPFMNFSEPVRYMGEFVSLDEVCEAMK